jgi:hypothetical protein
MGAEITAKRPRRQAELAGFYSTTKLRNRALTMALTTSDFEASVVTAIEARSHNVAVRFARRRCHWA